MYILQGAIDFVIPNRVSFVICAVSTTVLTLTRSVGWAPTGLLVHAHAHKHTNTHRVPVDNVGNWVLGCCFRLTDSSPFLILCSYTPSLSTTASLSFHFFLWFSDTTGIETCAAPNMLCGLHFEIEIAQSPCCRWPHSATHPCTLLPASCSLLPALRLAVVWWVSPWESKYVLLFPARFFIHVFLTSDPFS